MIRKKKKQFPRFLSFHFCPIHKIKNSEISENFLLLQFLAVYETQNLKTEKNDLKEKTLTLTLRKIPISEVSEFLILPYTQNEKFGNLGKFFFFFKFFNFYFIFNINIQWAQNASAQNKPKNGSLWC